MVKLAAWALGMALIAGAALFLLQKSRQTEAAPPAAAASGPVFSAPASRLLSWECPKDPARWPGGQAVAEVIETPERWQQFLAASGFQPPAPVDLAGARVAFIPFAGGGGRTLEAAPDPQDGRMDIVLTVREPAPGTAVPANIAYDCRLFVVPRDAGPVNIKFQQPEAPPQPAPTPLGQNPFSSRPTSR